MEKVIPLKNNQVYSLNTGLFINGQFTLGQKNRFIKVIDPSNEDLICEVSEGTEEDIDYAIQSAKQAFLEWNNLSTDVRTKLFLQLAQKIEDNIEEFTYIESLDNGKSLQDSSEDIKEVIKLIRYYAGLIENIYGKTYPTTGDISIHTRREPYGIVGCIVPWNYPLLMTSWKIFPAMAAGNSVVLKLSEETPLTGLKLAYYFSQIGFPPGLLNIITGYGHIAGAYLSSNHKIDKIAFTGSTAVGRLIMKASGDSNLKSVHLELGCKSPMIVFADADQKNALEYVIDGAFRNSSQNCACGSRLYIEQSIYDEFVKKLIEKTKSLKIGRFDEENVFI